MDYTIATIAEYKPQHNRSLARPEDVLERCGGSDQHILQHGKGAGQARMDARAGTFHTSSIVRPRETGISLRPHRPDQGGGKLI
jgi:hypothetical protein